MIERLLKIPMTFWICGGLGIHFMIKGDPVHHIYFAAAFVIATVHQVNKETS